MSDMDTSFIGKFRGFLFINKYAKGDNHPKYQGRFVFTPEQIRRLAKRAEGCDEQAEIVCDSAAWVRKDKNGDNYLFVSTDADKAPKQTASTEVGSTREDIPF